MKKQELIHLHGLLAEVASHYEERTGEALATPAYDRFDIRPTSIHRSKSDHKYAVFGLATDVVDAMHGERSDLFDQGVDRYLDGDIPPVSEPDPLYAADQGPEAAPAQEPDPELERLHREAREEAREMDLLDDSAGDRPGEYNL